MRFSAIAQIAGAAVLAVVPAVAGAAPLRAGAALPTRSSANLSAARRAATPMQDDSALLGFPILGMIGLVVVVTVVVVVAANGSGSSPG